MGGRAVIQEAVEGGKEEMGEGVRSEGGIESIQVHK